MYLATTDLIAVVIALSISMTLIITTALANARLQRKVEQLRAQRYEVTRSYEAILADLEAK
jgi:hypothetical protein